LAAVDGEGLNGNVFDGGEKHIQKILQHSNGWKKNLKREQSG
jgi:hypothetical protein